MKLGHRVRTYRKIKGCSISELSEKTKIKATQISSFEKGKMTLPVGDFLTIVKALDINIHQLFVEWSDPRTKPQFLLDAIFEYDEEYELWFQGRKLLKDEIIRCKEVLNVVLGDGGKYTARMKK